MSKVTNRPLRPGDMVEVRPPAEILATLDDGAAVDGMLFMPEMLKHVGGRFTVSRRVEKICDTAGWNGRPESRRMQRTVYLDDLRCDGSGHDGCQAGCRLYWREEWLQRVDDAEDEHVPGVATLAGLEERVSGATTRVEVLDGQEDRTYRCQATDAPAASEPLGRYDLRPYVREVSSGNVGLVHLVRVLAGVVVSKALRVLRIRRNQALVPPLRSPKGAPSTNGSLGLQAGELVQIRPTQEIATTLDEQGKNRGLWFDDSEMALYCGGTYRVRNRVDRFIDDRTGKMIDFSTDAVILDGVTCGGECSRWRWFCPRGIYPFWREAWLRRVESESQSVPDVR